MTPSPDSLNDTTALRLTLKEEDDLLIKVGHALESQPFQMIAGAIIDGLNRSHRRVLALLVATPQLLIPQFTDLLRERVIIDLRLRKLRDRYERGEDIGKDLQDLVGTWYQTSLRHQNHLDAASTLRL